MKQHFTTLLLFIVLLCVPVLKSMAQRPVITSFAPKATSYNEILTLEGNNFPVQANLQVTFGAATATIVQASATSIQVRVPLGAIYAPITVTNLATGLSNSSNANFMPSFGGQGITLAHLVNQTTLTSQAGLKQTAVSDLDNDGKNDIAYSASASPVVVLFRNTGTPGSSAFSAFPINLTVPSRGLALSDLNGDGLTDVIYTGVDGGGNLLFVLKNTSTQGNLTFSNPAILTTPTNGATRVEVLDINSDGKPEIVVSDEITSRIYIFINQSTSSSISFQSTSVQLSLPGANLYGLQLQDLTNDGKPEIVAANYLIGQVFCLTNLSSGSSVAFGAPQPILNGIVGAVEIRLGDLNRDGKADIALADNFSNQLVIGMNESTGGTIAFSAPHKINLQATGIWDLALADIDGDGTLDIATAHQNSDKISLLINQNFSNTPAFQELTIPVSGPGLSIKIADFDNDARPDILYTNRLDNTLSILRNTNCPLPTIRQVCNGSGVSLVAPTFPSATYIWKKDGSTYSTGSSATLVVNETGSYAVSLSLPGGCNNLSAPLAINSTSGLPGNPVFEPITPTCVGQNLVLQVSSPVEGATYTWRNANGYEATTSSNSHTIASASSNYAGTYWVMVKAGACETTLTSPGPASITEVPAPSITPSTTQPQCAGQEITLGVSGGTFTTYQWKKNGEPLSGKTSSTLTTSGAGSYTVVVSTTGSCSAESPSYTYATVANPAPSFNAPAASCLNQPVVFENTSQVPTGQDVRYLWTFGDGESSTQANPQHTYTSIEGSPYTVTLQVSYGSQLACVKTFYRNIYVNQPEAISLAASATEFCEGEAVQVSVVGSATSAMWSDGQEGLQISTRNGGRLEATITTSSGCIVTQSIDLTRWAKPQLQVATEMPMLTPGGSAVLSVSGGSSYLWSPAESLDDATSATPVASPRKTTTYTVTALSPEGCTATAEVTVQVSTEFLVTIPPIFVPQVDGMWHIANIEEYPTHSLLIINTTGAPVFEATAYTNTWDGTYQGAPLAAGVYYYVFKDEHKKVVRTGSITLLR